MQLHSPAVAEEDFSGNVVDVYPGEPTGCFSASGGYLVYAVIKAN